MPTIKQYRPGFFTGFENELKEFNSLDELFSLDFVDNFRRLPSKVDAGPIQTFTSSQSVQ